MKNKNDIQAMLKEAGILFAITLIAGLLLGFVYELTKEPIRQQEEKAVQEACQAVFADAEHFEELDAYTPLRIRRRSWQIPESLSVPSMKRRMLPERSWAM